MRNFYIHSFFRLAVLAIISSLLAIQCNRAEGGVPPAILPYLAPIQGSMKGIYNDVKTVIDQYYQNSTIERLGQTKLKILQKGLSKFDSNKVKSHFKNLQYGVFSLSSGALLKTWKQPYTPLKSSLLTDSFVLKGANTGFQYPLSPNNKIAYYTTDFANANPGGDWEDGGWAQEESMFMRGLVFSKPHLLRNHLAPNAIGIIHHGPFFFDINSTEVYKVSMGGRANRALQHIIPKKAPSLHHILVIDAPCVRGGSRAYTTQEIQHIFAKLYVGFQAMRQENVDKEKVILEFGNWGGKAYDNNLIVIYSLALLVLSHVNNTPGPIIEVWIYPFNHDGEKYFKIAQALCAHVIDSCKSLKTISLYQYWKEIQQYAKDQGESLLTGINLA